MTHPHIIYNVWLLSIEINLVVLHAARSTLLGTGQIFEGRNGLLATQIDDDEVGQRSTLLGLPVGGFLQVINLVTRVVAVLLFAVGILCRPRFARDTLAVGTLQIKLGDGNTVVLLLGGETFDGEVSTLLLSVELDGLPTIASIERTSRYRSGGVEVGLVTDVVVLVRLLQLELV